MDAALERKRRRQDEEHNDDDGEEPTNRWQDILSKRRRTAARSAATDDRKYRDADDDDGDGNDREVADERKQAPGGGDGGGGEEEAHTGPTYRRRWPGYTHDVPAASGGSVLEEKRPAKYMTSDQLLQFLNAGDDDDEKKKAPTTPALDARDSDSDDEMEEEKKAPPAAAGDKRYDSRRRRAETIVAAATAKTNKPTAADAGDLSAEFIADFKELSICHEHAAALTPAKFIARRGRDVNPPISRVRAGELRFQAIYNAAYEIANANKVPLAPHQQEYLEICLIAAAPLIYGSDWFACKDDFFARFAITRVDYLVAALTPRQFGKTTVVAIVALAIALHMRGIEIAIFAVGLDAAKRLLQRFKDYMRVYLGETAAEARIGVDKTDGLSVIPADCVNFYNSRQARSKCPYACKIKSLPATEKGITRHVFQAPPPPPALSISFKPDENTQN